MVQSWVWKSSPSFHLFYISDNIWPRCNNLENKLQKEYNANSKPAGASAPAPAAAAAPASGDLALWETVTAQGNKIRELKSKKATKDEIMKEVEILKGLKADYKSKTGSEYDANKKPAGGSAPAPAAAAPASGDLALWETVTAQGNKIRELKSKKASKDEIMKEVDVLKKDLCLKVVDVLKGFWCLEKVLMFSKLVDVWKMVDVLKRD